MRILVTGGAGFIGCNFVRYWLNKYPEDKIVVLDKLTYAGRLENLQEVIDKIEFIKGDICKRKDVETAMQGCNAIFNFAAETHVDRSINKSGIFVKTNVLGTYILLEYAMEQGVERFIQISTDEVYGSVEEGSSKESDNLEPSSPYSASKGGADMLVGAYHKTYGLPVMITRSTNNFGPYQYPEKLIPLFITNALQDERLPLYGDGLNVRDWLYVKDNCEAIDVVHRKGKNGEIYNIASGIGKTNIEVTRAILKELNKPKDLICYVKDRLGHDKRYSLDSTKIKKLGWSPRRRFEQAMKKTIKWYVDNKWWWESLVN